MSSWVSGSSLVFEVQIHVISYNFEREHFYEVQDYNNCIHQINVSHVFIVLLRKIMHPLKMAPFWIKKKQKN